MIFDEFINFVIRDFPELSDDQVEKFRALEDLYKEWNSKINVVSRKDIDMIYKHHILHSLSIAKFLKSQRQGTYQGLREVGFNILDLGTGGGFPGIPLSIMFPKSNFCLCDSIRKKITVARSVAQGIGLENVNFFNGRAESLEQNFDFIVSRAVTSLDNFYPWVQGKYNNCIWVLKGGDIKQEILQMCQKYAIKKSRIATWGISSWIEDEYFDGKYLIEIY